MRAWFHNNRWYLLAIVILAPIAVVVAMSTDWFRYEQQVNGNPISVSVNDTVDYSGASWSLVDSRSFDWRSGDGREADLIEGTELVTATIRVKPALGQTGPSCRFQLQDAARQRLWDTAGYDQTSFEISRDASSGCDSSATEPYLLQLVFVVPQGASVDARLLIRDILAPDKFLSFAL